MKIFELNKITKLYFSINDISNALGISFESAKVSASRYTKKGLLVRLKRDIYVLTSRMITLTDSERFRLANIIQTPSYISLTTALSFYGISTQQQRNFVESVALKRSKSIIAKELTFVYRLIKSEFYQNFQLLNEFFIATPEKALVDAIYLTSLGRYACDFFAIDFRKVDKEKTERLIEKTLPVLNGNGKSHFHTFQQYKLL